MEGISVQLTLSWTPKILQFSTHQVTTGLLNHGRFMKAGRGAEFTKLLTEENPGLSYLMVFQVKMLVESD